MKKFLVAIAILMASFTTASAGKFAGNDKRIVICYFEGNKVVFENVSRVIYYNSGEVRIDLSKIGGGGEVTFSGVFVCLEAEYDDKLVDEMKERFGRDSGVGGIFYSAPKEE